MSTQNSLLESIPQELHEQLYAELKGKFEGGSEAGKKFEKDKIIKEIKSWAQAHEETINHQNQIKNEH